jgi:hypothetical protein
MTIEDIRKKRFMPFLKVGMRVFNIHNQMFGKVTGANNSQNINVKFDGDKHTRNCHPQWKMKYFAVNGRLIEEYND